MIFNTIASLQAKLKESRKKDKSVGLVPTMGALHEGHLSLIETSLKENDLSVCSIYVNPTQFNNPADLEAYPRVMEKDVELLGKYTDVLIFAPRDEEIYAKKPVLQFNFGHLEKTMEGAFRPGHFNGVALVVSKLFHIVQPDRAYFGQKDLQQYMLIRQLVKDLSFDLEVICCPTLREKSGLALSSRNRRLNFEQQKQAVAIFEALQKAKGLIISKKSDIHFIRQIVKKHLTDRGLELEYFEIVDSFTLQTVEKILPDSSLALCIAAYLGEVRLIDNMLVSLADFEFQSKFA